MVTGLHSVTLRIVGAAATALLWSLAPSASAQTVRYIHTDALGSVAVVTDQNRNVIERREYEPYGYQLTPVIKDGPGYTGHVQDAATGLTYMQQRYYAPDLGRFLSVDPVTAYGGDMRHFGRYAYAYNNPYKFVDPDGRQSIAACAMNPANAAVCAEAGIATGSGATGAAGSSSGGGGILSGLLTALGLQVLIQNNESTGSDSGRPTGDDVKIDDKIAGQLGDRGWTEEGVRELTKTEPSGTSVDNTGGRNEPATVYGTKDGGHVVVNDKTGNVTQVSDKQDSGWKPDPRIEWKED
jgi:RHS repeat-associated protein